MPNDLIWTEIVMKLEPKVAGLAKKILRKPYGSLNWEDLAQESLLNVWEKLSNQSYLLNAAKNYMMNMIRHEKVDQKYRKRLAQHLLRYDFVDRGQLDDLTKEDIK